MDWPLLSLLLWTPAVAALVILLLPRDARAAIRGVATAATALQVALAAALWLRFDPGGGFQFEEVRPWLPGVGVSYHLGVDGLGLSLVALSALIGLVAAVAAYGLDHRVRDFYVLLLILQVGVVGVFSALDYILFFVFWELVLVPMYFLIGIWGGPRREYAAIKFFLYTMAGSVLMMVAILGLYFATGAETFDMLALADRAPALPLDVQRLLFLGFFAAFAVKVPVVPLHTWLPDAHVEAPTPVSVVLAAVLLKMGGYGFFRITHTMLPEAAQAFLYAFALLGVINIVWGALATLAQNDFKRIVAYSSVAHMGFVVLGLGSPNVQALGGAAFEMISHGLISAMLFLLVGVFYDRTHTRDLERLGGLFGRMPVASTALTWAAMANLGLPLLSGFVAEFLTLLGAFRWWATLVAAALVGVVLITVFNLRMLQRVVTGRPRSEYRDVPDVSLREAVTLVPLGALTLLLGLAPRPLLDVLAPALRVLAERLGG